ncbi:Holliday junction branch migration protein RuvA [uncultured Mitsuokella sp.]|uniref:Holliday junction branch migration protein RuvA n=1 Tax=uncultured Mitsuokella sp. TaxID=453120 RepID=UPI00266EE1E2|nr:Holliday junction branch migration protein RuvA [uncultured Mitsuokella sp.]
MIGYLRGKVMFLYTDYVLLDVHGVGYRVFIANSTRQKLRLHEEASLFVYTSVREDAIILYGFASQEEYDLFLLLISVSGIGPKVALGILSSITVEGLCRAIQNKQASILTKLPGIGKKSAERLILELKDKVSFAPEEEELLTIENDVEVGDDKIAEATAALQALGYTQAEITPVISKTAKYKTTEEIIKASLKALSHM